MEQDRGLFLPILMGIGMGVGATVLGWLKNAEPGKFNLHGLAVKLPIGVVVGAIAGWKHIPIDDAFIWAQGMGIITILDQIAKIIIRHAPHAWHFEINNQETPVPTELNTAEPTDGPNPL